MSRDPFAAFFSGDSAWGTCRPRGWGGFWLEVSRACPGGWPWNRFAFLARRLARLRLDSPVDVRAWGFKLRLKPRGSVSEARILFMPRYWDRAERRVLAKWLAPGSVFVDVGSNVGGYAFWAASLAGGSGRVLAFEPDPALARHEEMALETAPTRPRLWKRYVDDTFCILRRGSTEELLHHLNGVRLTIKFTVEWEEDGTLPFLDTLL